MVISDTLLDYVHDSDLEEYDDEVDSEKESDFSDGESYTYNNFVARYFGEIRRYALLTISEERALTRKIVHLRERMRRSLILCPVLHGVLLQVADELDLSAASSSRQLRATHVRDYFCITEGVSREYRAELRACIVYIEETQKEVTNVRKRTRRFKRTRGTCRELRRQYTELLIAQIEAIFSLKLGIEFYALLAERLEAKAVHYPKSTLLQASYARYCHVRNLYHTYCGHLLRANLRLVISVANKHKNRGVPFLDLIQEGNIGLMHALEKFEPERNLKFVTYAHWWVKQAMMRFTAQNNRTVRVPDYVVEKKHKIRNAISRLMSSGSLVDIDAISKELAWKIKDVEDTFYYTQSIIYLDQPITTDGLTAAELVPAEQSMDADVDHSKLEEMLETALLSLTEREAFVLRKRFGINETHAHSLRETGVFLGVSRERIRQIEAQALKKLRLPHRSALLVSYYEEYI